MPLSCGCPDDGDSDWWWFAPEDYTTLATSRGKRCKSCNALVPVGAVVARFNRERVPVSDIEERIHGDAISRAPWYLCERCADLYFSLEELGFCVSPEDDMRELVKEYAALRRRTLLRQKLARSVRYLSCLT